MNIGKQVWLRRYEIDFNMPTPLGFTPDTEVDDEDDLPQVGETVFGYVNEPDALMGVLLQVTDLWHVDSRGGGIGPSGWYIRMKWGEFHV